MIYVILILIAAVLNCIGCFYSLVRTRNFSGNDEQKEKIFYYEELLEAYRHEVRSQQNTIASQSKQLNEMKFEIGL